MGNISLAPNYFIFKNGIVINTITNKEIKTKINKYGYRTVAVVKNGGGRLHRTIHRLLALAYIPNPDAKPQINHIDGIKLNNSLDNLEWVTASENTSHAYRNGLTNNTLFITLHDKNNNSACKFHSLKALSKHLNVRPGILLCYIKYSKEYPFMDKYILELADPDGYLKLDNSVNFGRSIYVYDYLTSEWINYQTVSHAVYHTGLRCIRERNPRASFVEKLGYIISENICFVPNNTIKPETIVANRKEYLSRPYRSSLAISYYVYEYETKQEYVFKTSLRFMVRRAAFIKKASLLA
jgi:hypothetical protein